LVEASAFPRPCCLDPFASPTVVKRDAIEGHDSSWVPSNSWQRGGGDSSARPRRPKLRRFGPHRLSGRSPPLQPATARGRRPPAPKGHTTSFKAQWARRSRSSIVAHPQGNFCRPHRKCYRGSPCGFRGPANPEPVAHNGTAVVAGTPRSRSPSVMPPPPPPPRASPPFPLPSRHTTPFVFLYACSDSRQRAIPLAATMQGHNSAPSRPAVALPRRREANRPFRARSPA